MSRLRRTVAAAGLALALPACAEPGPAVVHYGEDLCDHCHMTISDPRYGGQLVTRTGRVYRFDDAGCLAAFVDAGTVPTAQVYGIWLNDHLDPETLIPVAEAAFLAHPRFHAPMGSGVAAVSAAVADSLGSALGAVRHRWSDVLAMAASVPVAGSRP